MAKHNQKIGNILFDSGSHKTFITRKVKERLDLHTSREETLGIRTFGSPNVEQKVREVVRLSIESTEGKNGVIIEAYVVDEISQINNQHLEIAKHNYAYLHDLWFSDACKFPDTLDIDILVGIDFLHSFQKDKVIRVKPHENGAIQTTLGWVLSAPLTGKTLQSVENLTLVNMCIETNNTLLAGRELFETAKEHMSTGGFNLRKWKTNSPILQEEFDNGETLLQQENVATNEETYVKDMLGSETQVGKTKVLGITWDRFNDNLEFDLSKLKNLEQNVKATKRNIPSTIAKLFDPLGLISPVVVGLKILFQELCRLNLGWDDEIPEDKKVQWENLVNGLNLVGTISLPRCFYQPDIGEIESCYLHGFVDARTNAYCTIIYLVYETMEGIFSPLICAKTCVAPLKELTIP